jgi:hypothetical protein
MKYFVLAAAFCFSAICTTQQAVAQKGNPSASVGCVDPAIRTQAQEIKQHFLKQNFVVYRDAMISMSSMEPYPVIVQLQRGVLYQIVFVGNAADSKMRIDIYNGADQKMDEKLVMRNRDQPNYISYSFVPEQTDTYMFMLTQKLKNKDMCGSFTIMQLKSQAGKPVPVTQYENTPQTETTK